MTKAGDEILAGINDAIAFTQGDESKAIAHVVMNANVNVKSIREKLGMTQQAFANAYGLSIHSLRKWESGKRDPDGAAKAYLTVIAQRPNVVRKALSTALA